MEYRVCWGNDDSIRAPGGEMMKKMKSSRSRLYLWGGLLLALMLGVMLAAYLIPWNPYVQDLSMAEQPPSAAHLLGTDRYGRDMFARVLVGGRTSISGALAVVLLITVIGAGIGTGSGWYGGRIEQAWMGLSDVFLAFPGLVLALAVAGVSGGGMLQAVLALAAIGWPKYARLSRRLTVSLKEEPYIDIARMRGISSWKIIGCHILPNMAGPLLTTAVLDIGTMMMELAALSFLGLGVKPPTPEWGAMMSEGRRFLQLSPWMVMAPGAAMCLTVGLFHLLGEALRDAFDPRER